MTNESRKLAKPDFGKSAKAYHIRPEYLDSQIKIVIAELGLKPDANMADIGAGTGKLSKKFSGKCKSITLFELSLGMIKEAGETLKDFKGELRFRQASYEYLGHVEEKFDAIVVGDAAHWFGDANAATKEFARALKPAAKIAVFSRQPDSNSPVVKRLHELLSAWDNDKNDPQSYSHPNANWVVKNDRDLDRKQGEHLIEPKGAKFITELMIMKWTKQDLLEYLQSRSTSKKPLADAGGAMALVIDPLFAEFASEVEQVKSEAVVGTEKKVIVEDRLKFPYQSGILMGELRNYEREKFSDIVEGGRAPGQYSGKQ